MRLRSWLILTLAFGSFVVLIAVSGLATLRRSKRVYADLLELNQAYRRNERSLQEVRTGIHVSSLLVRDYVLDPSFLRGDYYRGELRQLRENTDKQLEQLKRVGGAGSSAKLANLASEVDGYWKSFDPLFEWTPEQKRAMSYAFLRQQVMPRRDKVLDLTREIEEFNAAALKTQQQDIAANEHDYKQYLVRMLFVVELLGLAIAVACVFRVLALERSSERQRERAEQAEQELRRLSNQLVHAQEEERRSISRELHDEIGQMLTGLRMELRSLRRLHGAAKEQFEARAEQTKALLDRTLQAVRDIAMGLRPSMLDDLGLGPALEWQARDFSRRYDIPVTVEVEAALDNLPDHHRTNIFRIVQEALTNCARHAKAASVRISLAERNGFVRLEISDDGAGLSGERSRGLGLVGMQERARELGGRLTIQSTPRRGTVLLVEIPSQLLVPSHG